MAGKPFVVETLGGRQIPFLRGILVQSLVDAGLSFADAYAFAKRIRNLLDDVEDAVTTSELRRLIGEELERRYDEQTRLNYDAGGAAQSINVRHEGRVEPFSVGMLTSRLEGCGIRHEQAARGAGLVQVSLRERGEDLVEDRDLRRIIYETLKTSCCPRSANRYLSRCHLNDSGAPLIVLIGGATGTGKSTVATRLAYLLDIVRTQSTDMMREIIRCYLVPHVAPTLGFSSFEAWHGLPKVDGAGADSASEDPVVSGFLAQFGAVRVALEATIARAVKERHDLIVDGVHVLPTHLDLEEIAQKAVLVPLVLAVTTRAKLDDHFLRRSREQPDRDSDLHRNTVSGIWALQTFMVDQAQKAEIPVIVNWNLNETVRQVMDVIMNRIGERFPPDPKTLE